MSIIVAALVIIADQLTKILYVKAGKPDIVLIPGIIGLTYVENRGAAWGLFNNHQLILYIFSAVLTIALCSFFIWKYKKLHVLMRYALALIIAGAIGNLIDRFMLSYVRDMIQFKFVDFPVFNIADSAITIGGVMMLVAVLFFDKDSKAEPSSADTEKEDTNHE